MKIPSKPSKSREIPESIEVRPRVTSLLHGPLVPLHRSLVPLRAIPHGIILVVHRPTTFWKMPQSTPTREINRTWVDAVYEQKQRRKLVVAIVLLLVAITAVLVRDRQAWFGGDNDEAAGVDNNQPVPAPSAAEPASLAPAAEVKAPVAVKPAEAVSSSTSSTHTHRTVRRNSAKHEVTHDAKLAPPGGSASWGPARAAADRAPTSDLAQAHHQPAPYPLLTEATAVQGSVLLQALIAADGAVEELRVISGPTILVSAARQAVQQWRFKPYLLNGKAVETYARVTVNFTINVSNTEARYHVDSVTSNGDL